MISSTSLDNSASSLSAHSELMSKLVPFAAICNNDSFRSNGDDTSNNDDSETPYQYNKQRITDLEECFEDAMRIIHGLMEDKSKLKKEVAQVMKDNATVMMDLVNLEEQKAQVEAENLRLKEELALAKSQIASKEKSRKERRRSKGIQKQ